MNPRPNQHRLAPRSRKVVWLILGACGVFACGCARELETSYGRSTPNYVQASVNGTDVLQGMFSAAGHEVDTRHVVMTSDLTSAQTIVWFPDDAAAPKGELSAWFERWLSEETGRSLVYVGRDFDAAPLYWTKMLPKAPAGQQGEYRARAQWAKTAAKQGLDPKKDALECPWFTIEIGTQALATKLGGPWAKGVNAAKTEIELRDRLVPAAGARDLLDSGKEKIVVRHDDEFSRGSQVIVVANGSFLLNLPLVNQEHRKLAGKLIEAVGPAGRVVFLESGPGGPPIDPDDSGVALWRFFAAWPLNIILLQLAALGIIFCFARWPIPGRPKLPPPESVSDFGKHVEAVGRLLYRAGDRHYAVSKLSGLANVPQKIKGPQRHEGHKESQDEIDR